MKKLVDLMAYGPIKVHKIKNKCSIIKDYDADFTIVDPNLTHTILLMLNKRLNLLGHHMMEKKLKVCLL